jgi:hypothetical protein
MSVPVHVANIKGGVQNSRNQSATCTMWAYTALGRAASKQWQCFYPNLPERFAFHFSFTAVQQPDAETSSRQQTTLKRYKHPCPRRNSNPQSQQGSGRRPTPETARPLGSAFMFHTVVIIKNTDL